MTDATSFSPMDPEMADDEDEELMFEEADPFELPAPIPAAAAPASKGSTGKQPRRNPRRGRSAVDEESAAGSIDQPGEAVSTETPSAEAVPVATVEEPASAPMLDPRPEGPGGSKPQTWLLAIVALSLLTSLFSLGGLIAVGRTLARANADRAAAQDQAEALEKVPALVAKLDAASQRLVVATSRAATASPSGPPATIDEVRHELDSFKLQLSQRQPDGMNALNGVIQSGLAELNTKLDRLADQQDRSNRAAR